MNTTITNDVPTQAITVPIIPINLIKGNAITVPTMPPPISLLPKENALFTIVFIGLLTSKLPTEN